jgi:hypothetical protein
MFSVSTNHIVEAGTKHIASLTFRKCKLLSNVTLPEGLLTIGDAAFSLCSSLRQIQIPASVERIGVAAFCKSGLVTIQFLGIPKVIDTDVFESCNQLKEIVVPFGSRDVFIRKFGLPEDKIVEGRGNVQVKQQITESPLEPPKVNHFIKKAIQLQRFSYNACYFYWAVGDEVNLKNVFSGPITLTGTVTYEFRRKVLFIFVKSATASTLKQENRYELPVDAVSFARKYQDKYASRSPRIFIFVCDDGKTARVFDEVKLVRINTGTIMVRSLVKDNQYNRINEI